MIYKGGKSQKAVTAYFKSEQLLQLLLTAVKYRPL